MTHPPPPRRVVTIKANRETLLLVASAVAMAFALSYAVRQRPAVPTLAAAPQHVWVGQLPEIAPVNTVAQPAEPITSASLVVSPAALTSPTPPSSRPAIAPKPRSCDTTPCPQASKPPSLPQLPAPTAKQSGTQVSDSRPVPSRTGHDDKPSLMGKLNPLNHIPDAMRQSIDYAGDTLSSWMKRL